MLAILEHIPWPLEFIKNVSKIVKKSGTVVLEVPNIAWLPYCINLLFGRFLETAPTHGAIAGIHEEHIRFYTVNSLDKVFSKTGFKRVKLDCSGRLRFLKRLCINILSPDIIAVYSKK